MQLLAELGWNFWPSSDIEIELPDKIRALRPEAPNGAVATATVLAPP